MTDLYKCYPSSTLPLDEKYEELLHAFEVESLTTSDLLVLDPIHIAQVCDRSAVEVREFLAALEADIQSSLAVESGSDFINETSPMSISTGDPELDAMLGGSGIPVGTVTEIAGQSAAGKSHFLLQIAATVQLPIELGGLAKSALYISTESGGLETRRLQDIIDNLNTLHNLDISGNNVRCFNCYDTEELFHIMQYQVPIAIERSNVGVILIDSIAAHYRAEQGTMKNTSDILVRSQSLGNMSQLLKKFAHKYKLAVVVANQVADRFAHKLDRDQELDPFMFDHQLRWYSGWTNASIIKHQQRIKAPEKKPEPKRAFSIFESFDENTDGNSFISPNDGLNQQLEEDLEPNQTAANPEAGPTASQFAKQLQSPPDVPSSQESQSSQEKAYLYQDFGKVPALGLVWANEIDQRIVLKRETRSNMEDEAQDSFKRVLEVVFSPWCAPQKAEFQIVREGIKVITNYGD